jgi:4-amino-4-deoxy-L-arabinose transferase-like glycosyltransferase
MDIGTNQSAKKQDLIYTIILSAVALAIGIYLIATTVLIAKDGVMYIEYAKKLAIDSAKAMRDFPSAPGYSFFICSTNKLIGLFYKETSLESWIISAQCVSLLCKVIATVVLYFVGSLLVGRQMSFWAILILTILPVPAEYGSDALTEWPYIMFLAIGFWLLLLGARFSKWWILGCVGLMAGLGYLIRPECCQLVIYGGAWLLFNLMRPQNKMSRASVGGALILLLAGFAVIAVPYMRFKGYVFPEQRIGRHAMLMNAGGDEVIFTDVPGKYLAALIPAKITGGFGKFANNICEILMYYFAPFLVIGIYHRFRKYNASTPEKFFVSALILLNTALLIWLYHRYGFISKRHSLPLVSLTIFYVPIGLQVTGDLIGSKLSIIKPKPGTIKFNSWFFALLAIGIAICLPKLVKPIRLEKQGYRETAKWLRENTAKEEVIVVPDKRISFYSGRKEVISEDGTTPATAKYVVQIVKTEEEMFGLEKEYSVRVDKRKKKMIVICKRPE